MSIVISVTSLKGGVGKSTIATNLAVCFANDGYSVAIADADANQSSMRWTEIRSGQEGLKQIPAYGTPEKLMNTNISHLRESNQIVIIDGTPSIDRITSRILLMADVVIVPMVPGSYDMWASEKFMDRYEDAEAAKGKTIPGCFILNRFKPNVNFHKVFQGALEHSPLTTLSTTLYERVAYNESVLDGKGIIEWSDEKARNEFASVYSDFHEFLIEKGVVGVSTVDSK